MVANFAQLHKDVDDAHEVTRRQRLLGPGKDNGSFISRYTEKASLNGPGKHNGKFISFYTEKAP